MYLINKTNPVYDLSGHFALAFHFRARSITDASTFEKLASSK